MNLYKKARQVLIQLLMPLVMLLLMLLNPPLVHAAWETTAETHFNYSPRPVFDRINNQYLSIVAITNQGSEKLTGPFRVYIPSSSHQVQNLDGTDDGIPYINLPIETLAAGDSHQFTLQLELKRALISFELINKVEVTDNATGLELAEDQIAIFYQRQDGNYDGWGLHLWNGEGCGNYAAPTVNSPHFSQWSSPYPVDGVHPQYGGYYILNVEPGADCYNFIIHQGNNKALGANNSRFEPVKAMQGQQAFTFHGYPEIWYQPITTRPVFLDGARAHWLDTGTLLWSTDITDADSYRLYYASDAGIDLISQALLTNLPYKSLTATEANASYYQQNPHLSGFTGFSLAIDDSQARQLAKSQLLAVALDQQGNLLDATRVQLPRLLDYLYTRNSADADEASLGLSYQDQQVTASVWAPTAAQVAIKIYNAAKQETATEAMILDQETGIWSYSTAKAAVDRFYYRYQLTVFHPLTNKIETLTTTDPYSVGLSTNGRYSQFVDLSDDDLKPPGWDDHLVPTVANVEDSIIYEGHIRDFSILDQSTSAANRGKYLAFTEANSLPMQHLQQLQAAGLTHFHVLPANDIASIEEDTGKRVDVTDTVADLCQLNADAPVCGVESQDSVLLDVLKSYEPSTTQAQALVESMRRFDGFNWGYDPQHFAAPEGSYASNPDGVSRIIEMRAMNQALHETGLRVVLDVVYNHTASSGLYDNAVLDKVVPGYYHRLNEISGAIETSTCCENTATEHRMMAKLMNDSLVSFAKHFGFDGFRFDLMGHIPKQAILDARQAVLAIDSDSYFYGEGWNFGEVADNRRFEQASQLNMAGSEIGTYSDRQRDAVRSAALFNNGGSLGEQDVLRIGLVGNIDRYQFVAASGNYLSAYDYQWNGQPAGYSSDPADTVNYVSKHDNETLWDQLQYHLPAQMSLADKVRVQNIALSLPLLSQGIPFLQMGADLIRSKSMDRNTYDAGDWFNRVDFTQTQSNWNIGLPLAQDNQSKWSIISEISANTNNAFGAEDISLTSALFKEFINIRASSKLFRLTTAEQITNRIKFHNVGTQQQQGLVVMSLDDGLGLPDLDSVNDAIVVLFNGTSSEQAFNITNAAGFELHQNQQNSADARVQSASFSNGNFVVPALTTAVFVKPQGEAQGTGLSALPAYGTNTLYLRGAMNNWDTSLPFTYMGNDKYRLAADLQQGEYQFKIADVNFSNADIGGGFNMPVAQTVKLTNGGDNLTLELIADGQYVFELDASDGQTPGLLITPDDPSAIPAPYGETLIYLRGLMNDWGTNRALTYQGDGIYSGSYQISEGQHALKIADADWGGTGGPNLGGAHSIALGASIELTANSNDNISLTLSDSQLLFFVLDANDINKPVLTVSEIIE
ncbi:pullulanase-type alpha-1,6-glucosidase [Thalassomonas haliotis]|uniref:pullulanase n=1 Tax=Thalassomonas haliotis TaxID=485448 RepID=A0ABY7V6J6_9GAMM|nr:pullulanase-type alpha-1,6-glucosidase [Thalassomonas haliotis]WDE09364.1 pullulanase-type alpha-1,6-glucosidase [Thalassomonas haliotis]